jgi:hypothetical protein
MKNLLPVLALTTIPIAALPIFPSQEEKTQEDAVSVDQRLGALEARIAELAQRERELAKELEQVLAYFAKQSQAASALLAELDSCEALGFTAGINPQSREVLLAGFRAYYAEEQKDVPAKPAPAAEPRKVPVRSANKNQTDAKRP